MAKSRNKPADSRELRRIRKAIAAGKAYRRSIRALRKSVLDSGHVEGLEARITLDLNILKKEAAEIGALAGASVETSAGDSPAAIDVGKARV